MPYIGNPIYQSAFVTDQFSGDGTTTAFTMSVAPAGTTNVLVVVSGVVQDPSTYGVVGTTLTFSAAPPSGTGNISCRYLGVPVTGVTTTAYRTVTEFTATAGQTTFTPPSYNVGFINVYLNGVLLGSADYTATNGTTVVLATGASAGNLVTVESFRIESVANAIPNTAGAVTSSNIQTSVALTTPTMTSPTISSGPLTIGTTALGQGNASIMKNRIINGSMVINQRGFSGSVDTSGPYILDRWQASVSVSNKFTVSQNAGSVTPPIGFTNYMGITSSSAYTVPSNELYSVAQYIEGYNIADLGWGTANAKTVTLSFQVYSSLTGTFGGAINNSDVTRSYPFSFSIPVANTWTSISVTIAGDTSGTWLTTNGVGVRVWFGLGVGSIYSGTAGSWATADYRSATGAVSVVGTNGATFYITGVQLEVGSSATGFEYVNYQTSLANCQRYYWQINGNNSGNTTLGMGFANGGSDSFSYIKYPTAMRSTPTVIGYSGLRVSDLNSYTITGVSGSINAADVNGMNLVINTAGGLTVFRPQNNLLTNSTTAYLGISAEL